MRIQIQNKRVVKNTPVYMVDGGTVYHSDVKCHYIDGHTVTKLDLTDVTADGIKPCSDCVQEMEK